MYWKDLLRRGCSPHGVLSPRGRFKQRTPKHPQLICIRRPFYSRRRGRKAMLGWAMGFASLGLTVKGWTFDHN